MQKLWRIYGACLAFCIASATAPSVAFADQGKEYIIKATFVYKFTRFISWPDAISPTKTKSLVICAYGDSAFEESSPFFSNTSKIYEQASSQTAIKFTLKTIQQIDESSKQCHAIFIGSSEKSRASEILTKIGQAPILTISDMDNFAAKGGMIGFELKGDKIVYNLNNGAFNKAGLKVDAQLLEIANQVIP